MIPSDCPYRPGTDEWKTWMHTVYMPWQQQDPEQLAIRDSHRQALNDLSEANVPSRADLVMREVEEATGQRPTSRFMYVGQPTIRFYPALTVQISANAQPYLEAMAKALDDMAAAANLSIDAFGRFHLDEWKPAVPTQFAVAPSRHAKGRRRRPPAPPVGRCHHGNPRNGCRDCSMGRR